MAVSCKRQCIWYLTLQVHVSPPQVSPIHVPDMGIFSSQCYNENIYLTRDFNKDSPVLLGYGEGCMLIIAVLSCFLWIDSASTLFLYETLCVIIVKNAENNYISGKKYNGHKKRDRDLPFPTKYLLDINV